MNIGLDARLVARYPLLYRDRYGDKRETLMCYGFTCEDGWYSLIDCLSAKLELELMRLKESGVPEEKLPVAVQVKEKFGGLRFYTSVGLLDDIYDTFYDYIQEAENKSFTICEYCGKPGELRTENRHWIRTLCDECNLTK